LRLRNRFAEAQTFSRGRHWRDIASFAIYRLEDPEQDLRGVLQSSMRVPLA